MTKSEARAIEQRAGAAMRQLSGIDPKAESKFPWHKMSDDLRNECWAALQSISDKIDEIYAMAAAELG